MMKRLFHDDFKFHLEAIAILTQAIHPQKETIVESLDIILKWLTLRFFDTNTSVLLKSLEFIEALFEMLCEDGYKMPEFEGYAFVPYLVLKIGDPKDNVRKSVHNLFKQLTSIYPSSKIFTYLMEGLTSKNSKTRMECLVELGYLISKFDINVCQPTPAKALKEIAGQIGDRDNGVRSAALNAVVEAYNIVGEPVYKLVGRLNDKDRSYLEERIKRAAKAKPAAAPEPKKPESKKPAPKNGKKAPDAKDQPEMTQTSEKPKMRGAQSSEASQPAFAAPRAKREFELDYDQIAGGRDVLHGMTPNLIRVDDINEEDFNVAKPSVMIASKNTSMNTAAHDISSWLDLTIAQIANSDINVSMEALVQFEEVFKRHSEEPEVIKKIDQYLLTNLVQFRMLFSRHMENDESSQEEIIRLLKILLGGMMTTFTTKSLASAVSKNVLKDVSLFLLNCMFDSKLKQLEDCEVVLKTINIMMLKIIHNSDHTACFWALIKLLMDGIEQETQQKILDLHLKCLWKLVRLLPDIIKDIRVEAVLLDIHIFLKQYPSSYWQERTDKRPMETIRVVLRTFLRLLGSKILDKTNLIEDTGASELVPFLRNAVSGSASNATERDVRTGSVSSAGSSNGLQTNKQPIEILQDIFKKIGSKENSQEGLKELFDFKQQYPEEDVEPFISKTSQFFRNYIERGLKAIELDRRGMIPAATNGTNSAAATRMNQDTGPSAVENPSSGADKYLDRLKMLKEKYLQVKSATEEKPFPDSVDSKTEPLVEIGSIINVKPMPSVAQTAEKTEKKDVSLDDLKKRLQQIKKSSKT